MLFDSKPRTVVKAEFSSVTLAHERLRNGWATAIWAAERHPRCPQGQIHQIHHRELSWKLNLVAQETWVTRVTREGNQGNQGYRLRLRNTPGASRGVILGGHKIHVSSPPCVPDLKTRRRHPDGVRQVRALVTGIFYRAVHLYSAVHL